MNFLEKSCFAHEFFLVQYEGFRVCFVRRISRLNEEFVHPDTKPNRVKHIGSVYGSRLSVSLAPGETMMGQLGKLACSPKMTLHRNIR